METDVNIEQIDGVRLSLSSLSREFGIARETVSKRLGEAQVRADGERRGWPVFRLRDAAPVILEYTQRTHGPVDDPDQLQPKERLDYYRSEREKLKLLEERGQYVSTEQARDEMAVIVKAVDQMLDTLADILERDCQLSADAIELVERRVDVVRGDLAKVLEA